MTIYSYRHLLIRGVQCLISPEERECWLFSAGHHLPTRARPSCLDYSIISVKCYLTQIALRASNGQFQAPASAHPLAFDALQARTGPPRYTDQQTLKNARCSHPGATDTAFIESFLFVLKTSLSLILSDLISPVTKILAFCISQIVIKCQTCRHDVSQ